MKHKRHSIEPAFVQQQLTLLEILLPADLKGAQKNAAMLNKLQLTTMDYAACLCVSAPQSDKFISALRLRAQALVGIFSLASSSSDKCEFTLGDGTVVSFPPSGPSSTAHNGSWIDGFFLAALLRDLASLDLLCKVPLDILKKSSTRSDSYSDLLISTLQGFWSGAADTPQLLEAALEATDPGALKFVPVDLVLNIVVPTMELLFHIMSEDTRNFNSALQKALELHKNYWNTGKRKKDPRGFFPVAIAGLAAFAHDRGIGLQVESEYLPQPLITGSG
jgi:hypothetical protein